MSLESEPLFLGPASQIIERFSKQQKLELIKSFWPHLDDIEENEYRELFRHIGETIQQLRPYAEHFAFENFQDLCDTIRFLRDNQASTRDEIAGKLKSTIYMNRSDDQIIKSMELSVRLWLGLNVNFSGTYVGVVNSRRRPRGNWKGDETLDTMAGSYFTQTANTVCTESELDDLSAAKLQRVCLLHIEWTDCLNDHLKLGGKRGKRILFIYQQKSTLVNHKKAGSPIPAVALDEAIRSLELLLPIGDPDTRRLLEKAKKLRLLRPSLPGNDLVSNVDEFVYFEPQLRRLLNLLHGKPESFLQRLFDTRDIGQWAALWVGIFGILILTLLFGILATVYAIKQYFLAVKSYNLSVKSYELSLILACQQNATLLLGLCG